jgi:hypothetical protein
VLVFFRLRVPNRTRKISSLDEKERFRAAVRAFPRVFRYSGYGHPVCYPIFRVRCAPCDGSGDDDSDQPVHRARLAAAAVRALRRIRHAAGLDHRLPLRRERMPAVRGSGLDVGQSERSEVPVSRRTVPDAVTTALRRGNGHNRAGCSGIAPKYPSPGPKSPKSSRFCTFFR